MQKLLLSSAFFAVATSALAQGDSLTHTAASPVDSAAYLTARSAGLHGDFSTAASAFSRVLSHDQHNPILLENTIVSQLASGDLLGAHHTANTIQSKGISSQIGALVRFTHLVKDANWAEIINALDNNSSVDPLIDGSLRAWALLGLGQASKAFELFEELSQTPEWTTDIALQHSYARATVGDFEGALNILISHNLLTTLDKRGLSFAISVFGQLETPKGTKELLSRFPSDPTDPHIKSLKKRLQHVTQTQHSIEFEHEITAKFGVTDLLYRAANGLHLYGNTAASYPLMYIQAARFLSPEDPDIALLASLLFTELKRYDLAQESLNRITASHPQYLQARRLYAAAQEQELNYDGAIETLKELSSKFSDYRDIHLDLGGLYRSQNRMKDASQAYSKAIVLIGNDNPERWRAYYARAITHHALDQWASAEADFRTALSIEPNNPHLLNYLGYSLVERGEKLDEALGMIERAVEQQPKNGAIIDSLAWVYYQLGRYEDAVAPMELAATLEPVDPIVIDHLGDVYWSVGRKLEARFQWRRALSFDTEDALAERIRQKISSGLSAHFE